MANDHLPLPPFSDDMQSPDEMADAALTEALDDLERLLRGSPPSASTALDEFDDDEDGDIPLLSPAAKQRMAAARPLPAPAADSEPPLLSAPAATGSILGMTRVQRGSRSADDLDDLLGASSDDPLAQARLKRVVDRLISEIDIIASDCVAQALRDVEREVQAQVRERVRKHLHIVLPELLDDMSS